jgi:hypothetical protein
MSRIVFFVLLVVAISLSGCGLRQLKEARAAAEIDSKLNPWLGKTKDERIRRLGPPTQCAPLSNGDEACSWVQGGVQTTAIDCPPDYTNGGHRCSGGGGSSWEHRAIFVYRSGIAQEWNYWGSLGERSSKDSQQVPK